MPGICASPTASCSAVPPSWRTAASSRSILLCTTFDTMSSGMRLLTGVLIGCLATAAARKEPPSDVPVHTLEDSRGISPCAIGPSYWCRSPRNQDRCGVSDLNIGCVHACLPDVMRTEASHTFVTCIRCAHLTR